MRVLDCGANDGWMLANLWEGREEMGVGFEALDGLELNVGAAERAQERLTERGIPGKVVCDDIHSAPEHFEEGSYDVVCMFEVLEHLPEPRETLRVLARMCKPDGRIYISTPDGAYERGNIPDWARVESKGHLRAIRPQDLAAMVCEVGVIEQLELEQRLQVVSFTPREPKGKIVFYAGAAEALPEKILTEGLGGSETALCKMAEHFSRRGYDVRVYAGTGEGGLRGSHVSVDEDQSVGNVLYAPATAWDPGEPCDLFVSSRVPEVLDRTIYAERRVLWLHDADYGDRLNHFRASRATDIVVLSEFQRELLTGRYPFLAEHEGLRVSRNGIETSWYEGKLPAKKPWVVYSSSPDRGLDVLLECWPEIRKAVPRAELHFGYAPVYEAFRQQYPHLQAFHAKLEKLIEGQEGLEPFGAMGQKKLSELYKQAKVWAYPSFTSPSHEWFPEISCISAMEAQAAGCIPVCTDYGALRETVQPAKWRVAADAEDGRPTRQWHRSFVENVIAALSADPEPEWREWALLQDWEGVADNWEMAFFGSVEKTLSVAAA